MIDPTRSNTLRRIAGRPVQIEAEYDGVQRAEWLSIENGESLGRLFTGRYVDSVVADKSSGERNLFYVAAFGTKGKALTAARRWVAECVA